MVIRKEGKCLPVERRKENKGREEKGKRGEKEGYSGGADAGGIYFMCLFVWLKHGF